MPIDKMTPLHEAVYEGDLEKVESLIAEGHDINCADKIGDERTPLHYAAFCNQIDIMGALIKAGADVNAACRTGDTPLHEASRHSSLKAIAILISSGADIHAKECNGILPYDFWRMNKRSHRRGKYTNAIGRKLKEAVLKPKEKLGCEPTAQ